MERIDIHLAKQLDVPRTRVQKLIKSGVVTVDGKVATPHTLVREGAVVAHPPLPKLTKKKIPTTDIPIVYEDDDLVVIDKPAGIIVHPMNATDRRPTVIGSLVASRPALKKIGENKLRPGVVHRLDKDVSGLMVIAKTNATFEELKRQFVGREIEKEYVSLVYGRMPKDQGLISFKIARSKTLGRMVSRPEGQEGKEALTEYDVVDRFKTSTLVNVKIHTGRTHQIRTHFKAIGHPVVGDTLYRTKIVHIRPIEMKRLFLHSAKLSITMPDGTRKTFVSALPDELKRMLAELPKN